MIPPRHVPSALDRSTTRKKQNQALINRDGLDFQLLLFHNETFDIWQLA
jgi:hypothetical protein